MWPHTVHMADTFREPSGALLKTQNHALKEPSGASLIDDPNVSSQGTKRCALREPSGALLKAQNHALREPSGALLKTQNHALKARS
jgi:hypothetical protein